MLMTSRPPFAFVADADLFEVGVELGLDTLSILPQIGNDDPLMDAGVLAGQTIILLHDPRSGRVDPLDMQARARRHGSPVLFVEWLADRMRIGPLVMPVAHGCFACREHRRDNNLRRPVHGDGTLRGIGQTSPMGMMVSGQILAGIRSGELAERVINGFVTVDFASLETQWHRYTPVTACQHCDADRQSDETAPPSIAFKSRPKNSAQDKRVPNPKLSTTALRKAFVDRECGIVKHVFHDSTSALMPMCVAEMHLSDRDVVESGYGRAEDCEKSELVAILEAVERYAGHRPRAGQATIRGGFEELVERFGSEHVADPASFILHGEEQYSDPAFHLQRYSPAAQAGWCWGHSLRKGHPVLVPEQLVYYRTPDDMKQPTPRFLFDSSNGTSLGGCLEEAILGGLYEVVERDAYLTTWYSRQAPHRIETDSVSEERSKALIGRSIAEGYEIHLFDISTDTGIPAVWGMIVDPARDAVVKSYCASACHGRWNEAIFSTLVEITTSMGVYRESMADKRERAEELLRDPSLVRQMPDHVMLFSHPETYRELEFLLGGESLTLDQCRERLPDLALQDLKGEMDEHLSRVMPAAQDIIVVDQGFAELEQLGLSCVKVLVPGLLPVTFGHQNRRLSPERVTQAARARGYRGPDFDLASLNPFPHNFP